MHADATEPRRATFNVRLCVSSGGTGAHEAWAATAGVAMRVCFNFDGGGYNFHIFEFNRVEDARAFMQAFDIREVHTLWREDPDGSHHDLV